MRIKTFNGIVTVAFHQNNLRSIHGEHISAGHLSATAINTKCFTGRIHNINIISNDYVFQQMKEHVTYMLFNYFDNGFKGFECCIIKIRILIIYSVISKCIRFIRVGHVNTVNIYLMRVFARARMLYVIKRN